MYGQKDLDVSAKCFGGGVFGLHDVSFGGLFKLLIEICLLFLTLRDYKEIIVGVVPTSGWLQLNLDKLKAHLVFPVSMNWKYIQSVHSLLLLSLQMHQVGEEWAGGQVAVLLADNLIMQGTDGTYPKTETCTLFSEEKRIERLTPLRNTFCFCLLNLIVLPLKTSA